MRRRLRGLVQFLDAEDGRGNVYTDFEDEMQQPEEIEGLIKRDSSLKNYGLKVERFVREHEEHPTIRRLKLNEPITATDLEALEAILFAEDAGGSFTSRASLRQPGDSEFR